MGTDRYLIMNKTFLGERGWKQGRHHGMPPYWISRTQGAKNIGPHYCFCCFIILGMRLCLYMPILGAHREGKLKLSSFFWPCNGSVLLSPQISPWGNASQCHRLLSSVNSQPWFKDSKEEGGTEWEARKARRRREGDRRNVQDKTISIRWQNIDGELGSFPP